MFVNPVYTPSINQSKTRSKRVGAGGFEGFLSDAAETNGAASSAPATNIFAADALLSLQEIDDPLQGRKKTIAASNSILDELEKLKIDVLSGRVSPARLLQIKNLVEATKDRSDPALADVLAEIELRASVELAKLGQF